MDDNEKRYQNCKWYEKLWRRRWYFLIPFSTISIYLKTLDDEELTFRICWTIATGTVQMKMLWYYDWKEVKEGIEKKNDKVRRY